MSTEPGSDPFGDLQRWLMRAGARSISKDVAGRVRSTFGGAGGRGSGSSDVWDTATTEAPPEEAPECQWCPICRAARRYRDGGGTGPSPAGQFGGQFAGVGDTLAGLTRDAFSLFDAAMKATQRPPGAPGTPNAPGAPRPGGSTGPGPGGTVAPDPAGMGGTAGSRPRSEQGWAGSGADGKGPDKSLWSTATASDTSGPSAGNTASAADTAPAAGAVSDDGAVVAGSGVGWPPVVHSQYQDDKAAHERGDREEGGQPGDGGPDGGADQQVDRPAE